MLHLFHFILYALYLGLFIFLIYRWKFFDIEQVGRTKLVAFFALKAWAGLVLTLAYTYYYTDQCKSDIYHYFNDSKIISSVLFSNPLVWLKLMSGIGQMDNETFGYIQDTWYFLTPPGENITSNGLLIRVISVLNYFSLCNIYTSTFLLNFISFIGLTLFVKSLLRYFKDAEFALYIPIYLVPSVVFWSSGLLKEALLLPALGACIYACIKITEKLSWQMILLFAAMLLTIVFTKIYVAFCLILCSPLLVLSNIKRVRIKTILWLLSACYTGLLITGLYIWGGEICSIIVGKRNEFIQLALSENAGSLLDKARASTDCAHFFSLLPSSIVNALLRPFLWDKGNGWQLFFAMENLALLAAVVFLPIFFFQKPGVTKLCLSTFCFSFALLNYLIIGLTIPVMGAIVHYRVVAMPFLLLSALLLCDFGKLEQVWSKFKLFRS